MPSLYVIYCNLCFRRKPWSVPSVSNPVAQVLVASQSPVGAGEEGCICCRVQERGIGGHVGGLGYRMCTGRSISEPRQKKGKVGLVGVVVAAVLIVVLVVD